MKTAATAVQNLLRFCGVVQIILGLLFWSDHQQSLIPVHIVVGLILVLSLWTLAVMAAVLRAAPAGLVAGALAWGLVVVIFGLTQDQIMAGPSHWAVQVLHLLVGLFAIVQGEGLGGGIRRAAPAPQA
ncbi:MAG: hypothetical protein J2P45_14820 [Candidatus Dormibacteraeota bacterium]|nr:hypothetical protein [Candidatus Dormibacteraeota bacterium]